MSIKKELEGHISENSANNNANLKNKHTNVQNNKEGDLEDDDGYRESEDEDYNPGNGMFLFFFPLIYTSILFS